tara:strand:- start:123 stop:326 length:204 start_codon:yes stop_codon:yes gene_type:complete
VEWVSSEIPRLAFLSTLQPVRDVLVGITLGGGRAPQVAFAAKWIQQSVARHGSGRPAWATKAQTLKK